MVRILVADENMKDNLECSRFLANDKNFKMESTRDGISTLNKYLEMQPNILILNSHFSDIDYTEIINRLSLLPNEKHKSNIILTVNNPEEQLLLKKCSKIYEIVDKPIDFDQMIEIVNSLALEFETPPLTIPELNLLLLQLDFNIKSKCTEYLKFAIMQCYYYPEKFSSLNNVFEIVAKEFDKEPQTIREAFRKSLEPLNAYRISNSNNPLLKIFEDPTINITPKYFLDVFVNYLHDIKNKK